MLHTHAHCSRLSWGVAIGLGLFLWLCLTPVAAAADITVNSTADNTTAGDGLCTLREAVNNANANLDTTAGDCNAGTFMPTDNIHIPAGVYTLTTGFDNTNVHGDLDILSAGGNLLLHGAGAGLTTINGPGYVVGTDRILHLGVDAPAGIVVEVRGVTLREGHAPQGGGAIYVNGVFAVVSESIIADCEAVFAGGMSNNGNGGAIYVNAGFLTVQASQLLSNTARAGVVADVGGGAIYATESAYVTIEDSLLRNNRVTVPETQNNGTAGGAVYALGANLTIRRSQLISNSVAALFQADQGYGGAIYANTAALLIADSTLAQNSAPAHSGALHNDGASAEILRSTFSANGTPHGYGGAVANTGNMTLTNSTISGNTALMTAGGISNGFSGNLWLDNVTVSDNTCATAGGFAGGGCGVHTWGSSATVRNSILAGNHDLGSGRPLAPDASGGFVSLGNNLVGVAAGGFVDGVNGDMVGTAAAPRDARLLPLGDYGGPTQTHFQVWGSPTIDAIHGGFCPVIDQRGVHRPLGAGCDIGAVEYDGALCFLPVVVRE
jgi:CSLREA domain-containing protein